MGRPGSACVGHQQHRAQSWRQALGPRWSSGKAPSACAATSSKRCARRSPDTMTRSAFPALSESAPSAEVSRLGLYPRRGLRNPVRRPRRKCGPCLRLRIGKPRREVACGEGIEMDIGDDSNDPGRICCITRHVGCGEPGQREQNTHKECRMPCARKSSTAPQEAVSVIMHPSAA